MIAAHNIMLNIYFHLYFTSHFDAVAESPLSAKLDDAGSRRDA